MSAILDKIPKDLPITDPLLFSFLMIIDAAQFQVNLRGKYSDNSQSLPVFEYAVNSMPVRFDPIEQDRQTLLQNVTCGYFRDKPTAENCSKIYTQYPDGTSSNKQHNLEWTRDFEAWRLDCFDNIRQIITALIKKGVGRNPDNSKVRLLADIFGWSLGSEVVNFFYAVNVGSGELYGVGADFVLESPVYECCSKIPNAKIEKAYLEDIGFKLPQR